jgi:hypothetical protein
MKMAKASQEHVDRLRSWLQFNNEICKIDPLLKLEWDEFKKDWDEEEDFQRIITHCVDYSGKFIYDYYWDYYQRHISHIFSRIIMGYEVLIDNICDPDKDYLDYRPELKKQFEFYESHNGGDKK